MVRDDELNRLVKYALGMGVSVRFKPYVKLSHNRAEWLVDGSEITIYCSPNESKLGKILSLIHELSHHKAFVKNERKIDPETSQLLDKEDLNKKERKQILNMEIADSSHWEEIYKETNCQFNIEKLYKQREYDIWSYKFYYETDRDPSEKEKRAKKKELRKKYGV